MSDKVHTDEQTAPAAGQEGHSYHVLPAELPGQLAQAIDEIAGAWSHHDPKAKPFPSTNVVLTRTHQDFISAVEFLCRLPSEGLRKAALEAADQWPSEAGA